MESTKNTFKYRKHRQKKNDFDMHPENEYYQGDDNHEWDKKKKQKKSGKRFHTKQTHKEDFLKESLSWNES